MLDIQPVVGWTDTPPHWIFHAPHLYQFQRLAFCPDLVNFQLELSIRFNYVHWMKHIFCLHWKQMFKYIFIPTLVSFRGRMGDLLWHKGFKGGNDFIENVRMSLNIFWYSGNWLDGESRKSGPSKEMTTSSHNNLHASYLPPTFWLLLWMFSWMSESRYFFVINNRTLKKYVKRRSLWICVICGQSCAWGGVWTSSSLFGDKPSSEHQQHTMRHTWGNVLKLSKA